MFIILKESVSIYYIILIFYDRKKTYSNIFYKKLVDITIRSESHTTANYSIYYYYTFYIDSCILFGRRAAAVQPVYTLSARPSVIL